MSFDRPKNVFKIIIAYDYEGFHFICWYAYVNYKLKKLTKKLKGQNKEKKCSIVLYIAYLSLKQTNKNPPWPQSI